MSLALVSSTAIASIHPETLILRDALIKGDTDSVYYYASDGKRYVFPTEKTYKSWFIDFSKIITVTDSELASYPLGGNITYRPGYKMIKITTDPKVYAVDTGGVLRWVTSENIAQELYGDDWTNKIDDVPDSFFTNYTTGEPVNSAEDIDIFNIFANNATINNDKNISISGNPPQYATSNFIGKIVNYCDSISNSNFISVEKHAGVGPTMYNWRVEFNQSKQRYTWSHSDFADSGSFTCNNNILQAGLGGTELFIVGSYDVNQEILTWDGIAYRKSDTELTKEECEIRGGQLIGCETVIGYICSLPTSDAGKICSNSDECELQCVAPLNCEYGRTDIQGTCADRSYLICNGVQTVENGVCQAIIIT